MSRAILAHFILLLVALFAAQPSPVLAQLAPDNDYLVYVLSPRIIRFDQFWSWP